MEVFGVQIFEQIRMQFFFEEIAALRSSMSVVNGKQTTGVDTCLNKVLKP